MKTFIAAFVFVILLGIGLLPGLAQRGPKGDAGGARAMPGRVLAVNTRAQTAELALYFLAPGPDAPGKMPDEMARQAASLKALADQLRKQGREDKANQLMSHVKKLLCWRELNYSVTNWAQTPIFGVRNTSLDQIMKGDKVLLAVKVEGNPLPEGVPASAELNRDVEQLAPDANDAIKRMQDPGNRRRVFFEIRGEVTDTKPLTVRSGNTTVQIDTPDRYRYLQRAPLTPRDIRAGNRIQALVLLGAGPRVSAIRQINVLPDNAEFDFEAAEGGR
jgi:hypothetical protein